jgi:hypothetical protein
MQTMRETSMMNRPGVQPPPPLFVRTTASHEGTNDSVREQKAAGPGSAGPPWTRYRIVLGCTTGGSRT